MEKARTDPSDIGGDAICIRSMACVACEWLVDSSAEIKKWAGYVHQTGRNVSCRILRVAREEWKFRSGKVVRYECTVLLEGRTNARSCTGPCSQILLVLPKI